MKSGLRAVIVVRSCGAPAVWAMSCHAFEVKSRSKYLLTMFVIARTVGVDQASVMSRPCEAAAAIGDSSNWPE